MPDRPPDAAWLKLSAEPGLCGACKHAKLNETRRGTAYLRCTRAALDTSLPATRVSQSRSARDLIARRSLSPAPPVRHPRARLDARVADTRVDDVAAHVNDLRPLLRRCAGRSDRCRVRPALGDPVAGIAVTIFVCHVGYEVTTDVVRRLADAVDREIISAAERAVGDLPGVVHARPRPLDRTQAAGGGRGLG
jgi:hypothetical protein